MDKTTYFTEATTKIIKTLQENLFETANRILMRRSKFIDTVDTLKYDLETDITHLQISERRMYLKQKEIDHLESEVKILEFKSISQDDQNNTQGKPKKSGKRRKSGILKRKGKAKNKK